MHQLRGRNDRFCIWWDLFENSCSKKVLKNWPSIVRRLCKICKDVCTYRPTMTMDPQWQTIIPGLSFNHYVTCIHTVLKELLIRATRTSPPQEKLPIHSIIIEWPPIVSAVYCPTSIKVCPTTSLRKWLLFCLWWGTGWKRVTTNVKPKFPWSELIC